MEVTEVDEIESKTFKFQAAEIRRNDSVKVMMLFVIRQWAEHITVCRRYNKNMASRNNESRVGN